MILSLFKSKPLLETQQQDWIIETFIWAFEHFDGEFFLSDTDIILPTNQYFPDQVTSVFGMAQNVFGHVIKYAGMQNWPIQLIEPERMQQVNFPQWQFADRLRGDNACLVSEDMAKQIIYVSYNPQQINQPQDLVASIAQTLAMILIHHGKKLPAGGENLLPQVSEVVAVFLGFGVMLSNTAYQFKGGCGSCFNAYANRQAALTESELVFALALMAKLKNKPRGKVISHLKPHLRSQYKKAEKTLNQSIDNSANPLLLTVLEQSKQLT